MPPHKKFHTPDMDSSVPTIAPMLVIKTRSKNKNVRPGVAAGVAPGKRRSAQEMKSAREQEARKRIEEEEHQKNLIQEVADIEDDMHKEDEGRKRAARADTLMAASTTNTPRAASQQSDEVNGNQVTADNSFNKAGHDTDIAGALRRSQRSREVTPEECDENVLDEDNEAADDMKDKEYIESEDEDDDEQVDNNVERGKKKQSRTKLGRADITAVRETIPALGTPAIGNKRKVSLSDTPSEKTKKLKPTVPSGLLHVKHWNATPKATPSKSTTFSQTAVSNESNVQYGGMLNDGMDDELERPVNKFKQMAVGTAFPPMIKIERLNTTPTITKKAQRGGAEKWTLKHLPSGTEAAFSALVVSLARKKVGSREGDPWETLATEDIQYIVDTVFGVGEHEVEDDDVWCGLVSYRLNNWRHVFGSTAAKVVEQYIKGNPDHFPDEDTIQDTVLYMLEAPEGEKTKPFHWKVWDQDEDGGVRKKGRFQSSLILCTLALAHYQEIDEYPGVADDKPSAALILAIQAVEHALGGWKTGTLSKLEPFSGAKYGDSFERGAPSSSKGKSKAKFNNRATQYLPTIKNFDDRKWEDIFATVREFLDNQASKKKKKGKFAERKRAASSDGDIDDIEVPAEYVLESDED
ncbi:hypothetical protein D9615_008849 [Tricholomella constricta]|uniref:DUF6532 domain-containing protein n=1 Tax=Tricholomella constricta TaxID=117010 RepID=A0A8H5LXZ1_9AGAR|nr:hypothetical protein D9615_008849 [Tricholomella constricta]